jgi:hypothetical protein
MSLEQMRKMLTAKNSELANLAMKPPAETSIYPHWEMTLNATATIRFLPDGNSDNPFFWVVGRLSQRVLSQVAAEESRSLICRLTPLSIQILAQGTMAVKRYTAKITR